MGNCLVTKLKGAVNNNNLFKLGEIKFKVSEGQQGGIYFTSVSDIEDVVFENYSGDFVDDQGQSIGTNIVKGPSIYTFASPGDIIGIRSKYAITRLQTSYMMVDGKNGILSIEDINYMSRLTFLESSVYGNIDNLMSSQDVLSLNIIGGDLTGHLSSLASKFPNATQFRLGSYAGRIDGSFEDLAPALSLTTIQLGECPYIIGSIESFVLAQRRLGRTSATITCLWFNMTQITFNGNPINTEGGIQLSWSPNSSDNSKTDVTFNGVTITIDA